MIAVVVGLAITCTAMLFSAAGPRGVAGYATVATIDVCCVFLATVWWRRWPTYVQSVTVAVVAAACMSAAAIAQTNPLGAMTGAGSFAMLNGYAALAHSARVLALTAAIGLSTVGYLGVQMWNVEGDLVLAITKVGLNALLLVVLPLAIQTVVHRLGRDVLALDIDPLSGLLNRRGLNRSCDSMKLRAGGERSSTLVVIVIDLDDFKSLNDHRGHAVGDQALIAVSAVMRSRSPESALVARKGGEECS